MTDRLRARGLTESAVEELVARMLRVGYLDDRRFAEFWVESRSRHRPCGPARLRRELRQKGVPAAIVSEVLSEAMPPETEEELAVRAAVRKASRGGLAPGGERRVWEFLRRRGFGAAACRAALLAVAGPGADDEEVPEELPDELGPEESADEPVPDDLDSTGQAGSP